MPSVEENKRKKRTKILEAAYDLFSKNGINTTPIDEVVKCAGVAKGTFYLYFRDKYDLLDHIILHKSTAVIKSILQQMRQSTPQEEMTATDCVLYFVDAVIDTMKGNKELLAVVSQKISVLFTMIMDEANEELQEEVRAITALFCRFGYSREAARKQMYLLSAMISSVCSNAILSENPFMIEEIRPEIHAMVKKILA